MITMKVIAAMFMACLLLANFPTTGLGFIKTTSKDRVAVGWLTIPLDAPQNMTWGNVSELSSYNENLTTIGVRGHIGDRDYGQILGSGYVLQEGNLIESSPSTDWTAWRIFLYDRSADNFTMLNITTHKGSTSFGNPTFTYLISPNDKPCVIVTYFLFAEGAAADEAGELIFYKEIEDENLTKQEIVELFANATSASAYRYNSSDDKNCRLDALKIVKDTLWWSYFGVYQNLTNGDSQIRLATSFDLLNWNFTRTIDTNASQPTIAQAPNDAYIIAFEKWLTNENRLESHLKFHYYPNFLSMLFGFNQSEYVAELTLGSKTGLEGTPNIYNITVNDSEMLVCVGFSYNTATEVYDSFSVFSIFIAVATVALAIIGLTVFYKHSKQEEPTEAL